jgi:hypothetical protein
VRDDNCSFLRDGCNWSYLGEKVGIANNFNPISDHPSDVIVSDNGPNPSMNHRMRNNFISSNQSQGYDKLFSDETITNNNRGILKTTATHMEYHYMARILLKDLLFLSSMPLCRGLNLRIVLNLNQCFMTYSTSTAGAYTYDSDSTVISGGGRYSQS